MRLPRELIKRRQWTSWKYGTDANGRKLKIPSCRVNDASTWLEAKDVRRSDKIGFVFSSDDPYVGIDLDGCRDARSGDIAPWAQSLIGHLDSYTEASVSGTGVHIIARGELPKDALHNVGLKASGQIEIYDRLRYFAMTGQQLSRSRIRPRQAEIHDVLVVMRLWRDSQTRLLWMTTGNDGNSETEFHLAQSIVKSGVRDPEKIERLMRLSALVRDKWDSRRGDGTYLTYTIGKALDGTVSEQSRDYQLITKTAAEIEPEAVEWLWQDFVPLGKLTILAGHAGDGKSMNMVDLAADLSRNRQMKRDGRAMYGETLYLSAEDDPADTTVPRLMAADAKRSKIHVQAVVRGSDAAETAFNLAKHIAALDKWLEAKKDVRLVVFDPISDFVGNIDMWKEAAVRNALHPLRDLAQKHHVAVVAIAHLTKGAMTNALDKVLNSVALTAVARSVLMTASDPVDPERKIIWNQKTNVGKATGSLAYRIRGKEVFIGKQRPGFVNLSSTSTGYIVWEGATDVSGPDSLMVSGTDVGKRREAIEFLKNTLAEGPVAQKEIERRAKDEGVSISTLKRAKKEAGVVSEKQGLSGAWSWRLT